MSEGSGLRRQGSQRSTELPDGKVRASSIPSPAKVAQARCVTHAPCPSYLSPAPPEEEAPSPAGSPSPTWPGPLQGCVPSPALPSALRLHSLRKPWVSNGASALTREEKAARAQRALC